MVLRNEALWYRRVLEKYITNDDLILIAGSNTREFREVVQPYIQEELFGPLAARNIRVLHVDIKNGEGIDYVGDLTAPEFLNRLVSLSPTVVLCANLLEHLDDRDVFVRKIGDLLPAGGIIIASCPYRYPYHPDPIDTLFRPTVLQLAVEFPNARILEGAEVSCGTWGERLSAYKQDGFGRQLRRLLRLAIPLYKPSDWIRRVRSELQFSKTSPISATCVVLELPPST